jgi:hypothetical protein
MSSFWAARRLATQVSPAKLPAFCGCSRFNGNPIVRLPRFDLPKRIPEKRTVKPVSYRENPTPQKFVFSE